MPANPEQMERLIAAVERLAGAIEGIGPRGLGGRIDPRYPVSSVDDRLVTEKAMVQLLDIPVRTLGKYRLQRRLPGCWARNGKSIRWRVTETLEAWSRGIA